MRWANVGPINTTDTKDSTINSLATLGSVVLITVAGSDYSIYNRDWRFRYTVTLTAIKQTIDGIV